MTLNFFASLQGAMNYMMSTFSPAFLRTGQNMALSFGIIVVAASLISILFSSASTEEKGWTFLKALLLASLVITVLRFYVAPIPGIGFSFIGTIEDQVQALIQNLDTETTARITVDLELLKVKLLQPNAFAILGGLLYILLLIVIWLAELAPLLVIGFGLIGEKILVLVGPVLLPFVLIPSLNFIAWGWFKSLLTYAFFPVFALVWLAVGERFLVNILSGLPEYIGPNQYVTYGLYAVGQVLFYAVSVVLVPGIAASTFSGGVETGGHLMRIAIRR